MRTLGFFLAFAGAAALSASETRPAFSGDRILKHIKVLASDDFEGRGPGTAGEVKSVAYLIDNFKGFGLLPGNPDGTFIQDVPLVGITSQTKSSFAFASQTISPVWINDYVAVSHRMAPHVEVKSSDLVFCGYGIVAPEFGWDDFKGVDVRGKTIVVLVNNPPFKGNRMFYCGRWSYKYEQASALGAAGCLIVHEPGPAGYPFAVIAASQARENFDLEAADGNASQVAVEGWLTLNGAKTLFAAAGLDFAQMKAAALKKDFRPVPMNAKASFSIDNVVRKVASKNVVAKLEGSNPKLKDELVIYSAHWDHLGKDSRLKGDPVFHGALDNASGCAALIEIARAYSELKGADRPQRTILFLSITAEEKGLLGSRFYATHPLYPLTKTLADINMDGFNVYGPSDDLESVGLGASTLDDISAELLKPSGRYLVAELHPEWGSYYRSDHFEFAKVGVPACHLGGGWHYVGHPEQFGRDLANSYTINDYHKVTDTIKPFWNLGGAAQDAAVIFELGRHVADGDRWPEWKPGNEFKARRDAMMAAPH